MRYDDTWFTSNEPHILEERIETAGQHTAPVTVLARLAADKNLAVRRAVAANTRAVRTVLDLLATDTADIVRYEVAYNPSTHAETLLGLMRREDVHADSIQWAIANNPSTPVEGLRRLAESHLPEIRAAVAGNASVTADILTYMTRPSRDPDPRLCQNAASSPAADENVLRRMSSHRSLLVRLAVVKNQRTPVDVRRAMASDDGGVVRLEIAHHTQDVSVLRELVNDEFSTIRIAVARNLYTPVDVLAKLAQSDDGYIRAAVASNTSTDSETLNMLAADEDDSVRKAVFLNSSY